MPKENASTHAKGNLVFVAVMPHGPDIVAEITKELELMKETRAAMEEAGRRFAAARVDTLILIEPRIVHELQRIALAESRSFFFGDEILCIGMAAQASGSLEAISECYNCDLALAEAILEAGKKASLPMRVEVGKNGSLPLEWGAFIPLWYTIHPSSAPRPQVVLIAPSTTVSRDVLLRFGRLIAEVVRNSGKRVALIASVDLGHSHDSNNERFGFSPAAAEHDALFCAAVSENRLERLCEMSDKLLEDSFTDSLWQTLILAGALAVAPMAVDFLSYALPSYYGMTVAVFEPVPQSGKTGRRIATRP